MAVAVMLCCEHPKASDWTLLEIDGAWSWDKWGLHRRKSGWIVSMIDFQYPNAKSMFTVYTSISVRLDGWFCFVLFGQFLCIVFLSLLHCALFSISLPSSVSRSQMYMVPDVSPYHIILIIFQMPLWNVKIQLRMSQRNQRILTKTCKKLNSKLVSSAGHGLVRLSTQ